MLRLQTVKALTFIVIDIVVLDRRGRGVPRLLCRSDNVVGSCHSGTWEKDFIVADRGEGRGRCRAE